MPEHILVDKPVGITLGVYAYDIEKLYETVRDGAKMLKDDPDCYATYVMGSRKSTIYGMFKMGYTYAYMYSGYIPTSVIVSFKHTAADKCPSYKFENEVVLDMKEQNGIPVHVHYKVAYAVVSKEKGPVRGYNIITIAFYNENDEMVIAFRQDREQNWGEVRSRAGKYVLDANLIKEKKKKETGGCFFCDNAFYQKENGIIYIACNKYDGRVAEVEYTGEAYPEYCRRRI